MAKRIVLLVSILISLPALIYAVASDYLILQDIGSYKLFTTIFPEDYKRGPLPKYSQTATGGVLVAAGHFSQGDMSYEASYTESGGKWPFVTVEVTQHADADSDKWLLHEVEDGYRNNDNLNATVDLGAQIRTINGNNVYFSGIYGGKSYTWIGSNSVVVEVNCSSCPNTKPEPLEVVTAYLAKFPSTISLTDSDLKSQAHSVQWIKDEMDRRLWLCDKWFMQLQLKKAEEKEVYREVVKSMNVFLNYREKYYGVKADDDKNLLDGYLLQNNGTGIKAKLAEYKTWWAANKDKPINL